MTLLEVAVVAVIIGALLGLSFTSMRTWQTNERAAAAARSLGDLFRLAATEATRKESVHILFFAIGGNGDTAGNALLDSAGTPVPILLLDDGPVGSANQNCEIDAGEEINVIPADNGTNIGWGFTVSGGAKAPGDVSVVVSSTTGSTFATPAGAGATWVAFMPDGRPLGFDATCAMGQLGTGNGAIYITNGARDYSVVLNPLGGVRIHAWNAGAGQWQL